VLDLAVSLAQQADVALPHLNIGGGLGIPYFNGDVPLDLAPIGAAWPKGWPIVPMC
jgi:diaminopimelate decarboxylase